MMLFDNETTGLIVPGERDLNKQPHIIEFAAVIVNSRNETQVAYSTFINPGIPLSAEITKITGITDSDLVRAPTFAAVLPAIRELFMQELAGDNTIIAHNVMFDLGMLLLELERLGLQYRFPYPWNQIDTVPLVPEAAGGRSLAKWAKHSLGDSYAPQTHRAMGDVEMLLACWKTHDHRPL